MEDAKQSVRSRLQRFFPNSSVFFLVVTIFVGEKKESDYFIPSTKENFVLCLLNEHFQASVPTPIS